MIDVFDLYEDFCGEYNTHQRAHVRPESTFLRWVNNISKEIFEDKFKEWQKSQKVTDDLARPFLISKLIKISAASNLSDLLEYPADYAHFSSARFFTKEMQMVVPDDFTDGKYYEAQRVEYVEHQLQLTDNNRWDAILNHKMMKPTLKKPAMTQYAGGFKVAPKGLEYVIFDYLREPALATFDYTQGPDDTIVYNATTSKKLEWSALLKGEFLTRLGMKYGKFLSGQSQLIYETSNAEKNKL